ncbi:MAG: hypothetical protein ACRENX_13055 [Candidatus Dormibacteria bacterium]
MLPQMPLLRRSQLLNFVMVAVPDLVPERSSYDAVLDLAAGRTPRAAPGDLPGISWW